MTAWTRKDIETAFIREFSVLGANLGSTSSTQMRSERVRLELLRNNRENRMFHDSGMTYRDAYRACFGRVLEVRDDKQTLSPFAEEDELDNEFA